MSENILPRQTIELVKSLAKGPCGCQYNMGSFSPDIYDPMTGKVTKGHYDQGPRTHYCRRCQARAALDADGIEYDKDDKVNWNQFITDHPGARFNVDAARMMPSEGMTVVAGTYTFGSEGLKKD